MQCKWKAWKCWYDERATIAIEASRVEAQKKQTLAADAPFSRFWGNDFMQIRDGAPPSSRPICTPRNTEPYTTSARGESPHVRLLCPSHPVWNFCFVRSENASWARHILCFFYRICQLTELECGGWLLFTCLFGPRWADYKVCLLTLAYMMHAHSSVERTFTNGQSFLRWCNSEKLCKLCYKFSS